MREESLKWWNNNIGRHLDLFLWYSIVYFTPAKTPGELTGREIEIIYKQKII